MDTHVKVTAWLRIVSSAFYLVGVGALMLFAGGLTALMGASGDADAVKAAPWIMVMVTSVAAVLGVSALPGLITGWGLLNYQPWARIVNIVLSVLDLFAIPVGTALGAYSLWVMFHPETVALFEGGQAPGRYPTHY
jgi:hypothetical protein